VAVSVASGQNRVWPWPWASACINGEGRVTWLKWDVATDVGICVFDVLGM